MFLTGFRWTPPKNQPCFFAASVLYFIRNQERKVLIMSDISIYKGKIKFEGEPLKCGLAYLDINKNVWVVNEKERKTAPAGIRKVIDEVYKSGRQSSYRLALILGFLNQWAITESINGDALLKLDKFASIVDPENCYIVPIKSYFNYYDVFSVLRRIAFPIIAEAKRNNPTFSPYQILQEAEELAEKKERESFFQKIASYTTNSATITSMIALLDDFEMRSLPISMSEIVIATYWYEHGAEDIYKDCDPSSDPDSLKDWQYNLVNHLAELIQKAREMGYTLKKEPFPLACRNIQQNYYIWKEKDTNLHFAARNEHPALHFSACGLTTIVPTTVQEMVEEADQQNNCVNRIYTQEVANGRTHIIFVRKEDNLDSSYITCEVNNKGEVKQYRRAYNEEPAEEDIPFLKAFQQHLAVHWKDE